MICQVPFPRLSTLHLRIWFDSHKSYEIGPHFIKEETYLGVKILKIVKHRVVTLGFEPGLPWEFMFLNTSKETVLASSITLSSKELSSTVWGSVYRFGNVFLLDLFLISDVAYLSCWVNSGFGAYCFPRLCLRLTINRHFWENVSLSYLFPFFPSLSSLVQAFSYVGICELYLEFLYYLHLLKKKKQ